jgi:bile acid:Na+ symporter, BASS family
MNLAALIPIAITTSIVLLVVGIGLHSRPRDAISLIRQPGLLFRSVLSMNVVMPVAAAALVVAFRLPAEVNVALVALAMSPVPPLLPKKERQAVGDASYGIGLSVTVALLAIITVPVTAAWLGSAFGREGVIAPLTVAKTVLTTVLMPLAVGMALQRWAPAFAARLARPLAAFGLALLLVSVLPMLVSVWPAVVALFGSGSVLALAAMAIIGLSVGHALGGPRDDDRTVLALSTTSRHPAVALGITAAGGVATRPALAAILVYVVVAILISIPYLAWRKRVSLRLASPTAIVRASN